MAAAVLEPASEDWEQPLLNGGGDDRCLGATTPLGSSLVGAHPLGLQKRWSQNPLYRNSKLSHAEDAGNCNINCCAASS